MTTSSDTGYGTRFAAVAAGCMVLTSVVCAAHQSNGTANSGAEMRLSKIPGVHGRPTIVGSGTASEFPQIKAQKVRPTTDRERLIASLRRYIGLGPNWDGEGAATPNLSSLRAASHFACALSDEVIAPEPMLHASGNAGLVWDEDELYGEIEFLPGNRAAYFFQIGQDKHKGVLQLPTVEIPAALRPLLPVA